jgi:hypothetical protein
MEAVGHANNYKLIIDRSTPMTNEEVAKMVKTLRGLFPASPYVLDENLVIEVWRNSMELKQHNTEDLPTVYAAIVKTNRSFPSLPDVLEQFRVTKNQQFKPAPKVDMTDYITTGYGPSMYAGYVEGHAELNEVRTKHGYKAIEALDYAQFITLHAPSEQ